MKTALSINQPFKDWVNHLKQDIRSAQIKAAVRVNSELLHLYWQLGAEIIERQKEMTWGSGFLEELSRELMAEFPDMKGFSYRNIRSIKQWYLFYNEPHTIWQQVVAKLDDVNMQQLVAQLQEGCLSSCLKTYRASCLQSKTLKQHFLI